MTPWPPIRREAVGSKRAPSEQRCWVKDQGVTPWPPICREAVGSKRAPREQRCWVKDQGVPSWTLIRREAVASKRAPREQRWWGIYILKKQYQKPGSLAGLSLSKKVAQSGLF